MGAPAACCQQDGGERDDAAAENTTTGLERETLVAVARTRKQPGHLGSSMGSLQQVKNREVIRKCHSESLVNPGGQEDRRDL